ncbi:helix-turn-helix transcriptional regulator [Fibrella forsythiae]|uniref:Response regulator transcription factor n=1 Tax=Fibrella forsythiae TaxID=2817061 RepID=A0ABS3JFH1_9BACT|nr:LuxR C-terminal-related transcriptional regulator [Fibrella forsythiae]MBO0948181.1 response regulator transcription factor [Fibrella forsythiae]
MPSCFMCWFYVLLMGFCHSTAWGQSTPFQQIEERVYAYNNALQYEKSQALLLPILSNSSYSADDHYQAAILLSYTYKRLLDYTTTLQFLGEAEQLASRTNTPAVNTANVLAQKAFVYFDTHAYAKSENLMGRLAKTNFRYISQEDRAKLIHQQGYLLFLDKRYPAAEATYDRALADLRVASGCDLPMILVKKMQLYAAMNRMNLALKAFKTSNRCADSCGIIKYRIYAYDELSLIYKRRKDMAGFAAVNQVLDSLNEVYSRSEKIADLHNQKETIKQQAFARQLDDQRRLNWLTGVGSLSGLVVLLLIGLLMFRKQQRRLASEQDQLQLPVDLAVINDPVTPVSIAQKNTSALSERQQLVVAYLLKGRSNREIADAMCISENTVKYHIKNIYDELDVKNRAELLARLRD